MCSKAAMAMTLESPQTDRMVYISKTESRRFLFLDEVKEEQAEWLVAARVARQGITLADSRWEKKCGVSSPMSSSEK